MFRMMNKFQFEKLEKINLDSPPPNTHTLLNYPYNIGSIEIYVMFVYQQGKEIRWYGHSWRFSLPS